MDALIEKISIRETFKSFLPAFWGIIFIIPLLKQFNSCKFLWDKSLDIYNISLLIIVTALFGILISAIDMPKQFCLFKKTLPTEKLIKELPNISKSQIYNSYFDFYNKDISSENKSITEKYTNYYHFCYNMTIVSSFLLLLYFFLDTKSFFQSYAFPILIIMLISIIGVFTLLYGKGKIKDRFDRHFKVYKKSNYYNTMRENNIR